MKREEQIKKNNIIEVLNFTRQRINFDKNEDYRKILNCIEKEISIFNLAFPNIKVHIGDYIYKNKNGDIFIYNKNEFKKKYLYKNIFWLTGGISMKILEIMPYGDYYDVMAFWVLYNDDTRYLHLRGLTIKEKINELTEGTYFINNKNIYELTDQCSHFDIKFKIYHKPITKETFEYIRSLISYDTEIIMLDEEKEYLDKFVEYELEFDKFDQTDNIEKELEKRNITLDTFCHNFSDCEYEIDVDILDNNLKEVSKLFPETHFTLVKTMNMVDSAGFIKFYKNGKSYSETIELKLPKFDKSKLK